MAKLLKVHGSQNHFFILDQTELKKPLSNSKLKALARKITNPKKGLLQGADGLLVIDKPLRKGSLALMRVFNADGSQASMCGNGLRTVARYLSEKYRQKRFLVDTINSSLRVHQEEKLAPRVPAYAVEISPVSFNKKDLPFNNLGRKRIIDDYLPEIYPGLRFTAIAVPNPHLISFVSQKQINGSILGSIGKRLNGKNAYFPAGVNVNFVQILDHNKLFVRTYERGVGFTNACGTGMSASALAAALTHPTMTDFNTPIAIYNPGGMVKVILHYEKNHYWMELIGNATITHLITISEKDLRKNNLTHVKITTTDEQKAYEEFLTTLPQYNTATTLA